MSLTKIIPRLHAALPIGRASHPALESLYLRLFFAYKRYVEDPYAALAARRPDLFRGGHVLDVGANVGYTAMLFARAIQPGFRVFAFEPESLNVARMRRVLSRHKLENVEIISAAVGEADGKARLVVNPQHPGDHRIATSNSSEAIEVDMITIDRFVETHQVDPVVFIKIDVQGFELPVSRGMARLIARTSRLSVGFELSDDVERFGYDGSELIQFYRDRGFRLHLLTHREDLIEYTSDNLARLQAKRGYADVLASR